MGLTDAKRQELEAMREFCLRSLDDLDKELADGGIDQETFEVLWNDYTARAAGLSRQLGGTDGATSAAAPRNPRWMLTVVALAIMALTVSLGAAMFAAPRGDRGLTGKDLTPTTDSVQETYDDLVAAVEAAPRDLGARLDLGLFLFQAREYGVASEQLLEAVRIDPRSLEAQAYYGWVVWQLSQLAPEGDGKRQLVGLAAEHLGVALEVSPEDLNANTFYGIVALRGLGDAASAVEHLEKATSLAGAAAPPMLVAALDEARGMVSSSPTTID